MHKAVAKADKSLTVNNLSCTEEEMEELYGKQRNIEDQLQRWRSKVLHGRYPSVVNQKKMNVQISVLWLTNGYLFPETEGFLMAIQDEVIATRNYQKYIVTDNTFTDDKCASETIPHITGACERKAR